jgi:hypothetical protein
MPSRIVTGTLYKHSGEAWANARLDFTLITDTAIRPGEALPVWSRTVYTTSAGAIPAGVSLEVPATDAWRYRLKIESNTTLEFYLTDGPPITIDEMVILAGQGGSEPVSPEWPFLVNLYTSTQMADEDDIATADGAGNIVFRKLSALLGSAWTWLQAAIGAVPDGSDLISTDDPRLSDARTPTAHAATHAATGSDPIAPGDIGAMPLVSPAVAGNLVVQAADGTVVDAGYAADENATPGSVARRNANGQIINNLPNVSAISRTTGALTFVGASADANRDAQLHRTPRRQLRRSANPDRAATGSGADEHLLARR